MNPTPLSDSLFSPRPAIHANGDRHNFRPAHVSWERKWFENNPLFHNVWYTDGRVPSLSPMERKGVTTIGLLLEPPDLHAGNYRAAEHALDMGFLDVLFTHQPDYFDPSAYGHHAENRIRTYPLGGTMIHESDWRIWDKTPIVTAVASDKRGLPGHVLRHEIISEFQDLKGFAAFGPSYIPIPLNSAGFYHKIYALQDAAYSLAIEPVNTGLVLSEHVLDCFLTGTVPIYWGPPDALRHWGFDELGVIRASRKEGLIRAVDLAFRSGMEGYEERRGAIERNFIRAHEFTCTEDWLFRNYQELFE